MPSTATVTGKTGPNMQITSLALPDVSEIVIDLNHKVIRFDDSVKGTTEYDLVAATTLTVTLSSGNATVTLS